MHTLAFLTFPIIVFLLLRSMRGASNASKNAAVNPRITPPPRTPPHPSARVPLAPLRTRRAPLATRAPPHACPYPSQVLCARSGTVRAGLDRRGDSARAEGCQGCGRSCGRSCAAVAVPRAPQRPQDGRRGTRRADGCGRCAEGHQDGRPTDLRRSWPRDRARPTSARAPGTPQRPQDGRPCPWRADAPPHRQRGTRTAAGAGSENGRGAPRAGCPS